MKIAVLQAPLFWENSIKNKFFLDQKISKVSLDIDLIVLPEMFTSGFTMNPKSVTETMQGDTILWLKEVAKSRNSAITGSLVIEENGNYFNRLVFVFPDGRIQQYDKRHLFTLVGEDKVYTSGAKKLIVDYKGFKICPFICYDLRFPVFSRNVENYDVLIYVANWPRVRISAWDTLLKARAIENMSYVVGVNRIGSDGNHHEYNGHSQVLDFLGNHLLEPQEHEGIFIVEIDKNTMLKARAKYGFLNDKDDFQIT